MPFYRMPDGNLVEAASPQEAMQKAQSASQLTHSPSPAGPPTFHGRPATMGERYSAGAAETLAEFAKRMGLPPEQVAEGPDGRRLFRETPTSQWSEVDPRRLEWGDAAEVAGRYAPQTVGGVVGLLSPWGKAKGIVGLGIGITIVGDINGLDIFRVVETGIDACCAPGPGHGVL